jgi:hypothetical protein
MPLYYFHVHYKDHQRDLEGVELAGDREAWQQATRACGEMMKDLDGDFEPGPEWRLEVTDAEARPVLAVHFFGEMFRNGT